MKVFGVMRFATDPVLKKIGTDACVAEMRLCYTERNKKSTGEIAENTHFFDFTIWDKAAELVCKHFQKGDAIIINDASPRVDNWERDGKKHSKVIFRINEFAFPPSRRAKDSAAKEEKPVTQAVETSPF